MLRPGARAAPQLTWLSWPLPTPHVLTCGHVTPPFLQALPALAAKPCWQPSPLPASRPCKDDRAVTPGAWSMQPLGQRAAAGPLPAPAAALTGYTPPACPPAPGAGDSADPRLSLALASACWEAACSACWWARWQAHWHSCSCCGKTAGMSCVAALPFLCRATSTHSPALSRPAVPPPPCCSHPSHHSRPLTPHPPPITT